MAFKVFDTNGRLLVTGAGGGGGGTGTVTSVALSVPSILFTNPPSGSPITTSGTITVNLIPQTQKTFFAGPISGADANPTFRAIQLTDLPGGIGSGTVTSFSAGDLSPLFTTSIATSTTTPALTFALNTHAANTVFAGPTTGADAAPTFRSLVLADIPSLPYWALVGNAPGNDTSFLGTTDNHDILFKTFNTTRGGILKTGEWGINSVGVAGTQLTTIGYGATNATNTALFQNSSNYNTLAVLDDGSIGIGTITTDVGFKMTINGSATRPGGIYITSVTSSYGMLIDVGTTAQALYVSNSNAANYAVYAASGVSYFRDNVGMGAVAPAAGSSLKVAVPVANNVGIELNNAQTSGMSYGLKIDATAAGTQTVYGAYFNVLNGSVNKAIHINAGDFTSVPNFGKVGFGIVSPTAILHLQAGTATAGTAQLKLDASTLLTTPEIGAIEFVDNGTTGHLYVTLNVAGILTRVQIV